MKTVSLTCIGCPLGCDLQVHLEGETITSVEGNTCPRGDAYARREVTNPTRMVTGSVAVTGSKTGAVTVSCKTSREISKAKVLDCARALRGITAQAPIHIGDILEKNVANTGADLVATKEIR